MTSYPGSIQVQWKLVCQGSSKAHHYHPLSKNRKLTTLMLQLQTTSMRTLIHLMNADKYEIRSNLYKEKLESENVFAIDALHRIKVVTENFLRRNHF